MVFITSQKCQATWYCAQKSYKHLIRVLNISFPDGGAKQERPFVEISAQACLVAQAQLRRIKPHNQSILNTKTKFALVNLFT